MPVSGKSAAVSGGRLLDLLEPGWRREAAAGVTAADLDVAPGLPLAAAKALGEQSRTLTVAGAVERWPACVIVALAHVTVAAGTRSFWQAWHRAAGLRASKRSADEWGRAFLAALYALGLPAAGSTADDAVLAHAVTSGRADQNEAAGHGQAARLRLDPFGGGVLRVDAASGQARAALPEEVVGTRLLAFDADGEPVGQELPAEAVWMLYPATAELRSDIQPRTLVASTLPLSWRGWRLVQLDLRDVSWLALHNTRAPGTEDPDAGSRSRGDEERRVVRGRTKPVLRTGLPIPGVTTVAGNPVFAGPPQVLLPPGQDRWRVEARRAESGAVLASVTATGDAWCPDALWRNVPRPLLGELAITVTPGLRRAVVLAEGLGVTAYPMPRLTSPCGLEPADAVISAPPGMTVSPAAVAYREDAVTREITCVAGTVTARLAVTPPHIRLRVDPEPGSGGAATPWHHSGPLRLTSDDLWGGGALRIDLPTVAVPPPVTIIARSGGEAAGKPVQVLDPTGDGRYPLRRLLDTVTVHGHAELTIAVGATAVTIATISGTSHGNDPWAMA
jgi:hypothetical protein